MDNLPQKKVLVQGAAALTLLAALHPRSRIIIKRYLRLTGFFCKQQVDAIVRRESVFSYWSRWSNMYHLLKIEKNHQLNIEAVGGPEAAARDYEAVLKTGVLAHVRTQADIADKSKKAKVLADSTPALKHMVMIGAGHGHAHVLRMAGMNPIPGLRITLITRDTLSPYSGMIPGFIAGDYTLEECNLDIILLAEFAKIRVIRECATGIDFDKKQVFIEGRNPVSFDYLSINVGVSRSGSQELASLPDVTTIKPIDKMCVRIDKLFERARHWSSPKTICMVGSGAGGVEVTMCALHRLQTILKEHGKPTEWIKMVIVGSGARLAPQHGIAVSNEMKRLCDEKGITYHLGHSVIGLKDKKLSLANGKEIDFDECLWNTDGASHDWLKESGLKVDEKGFVITSTTLQSLSHPNVFALGDCGTIEGYRRPKSGVFAVFAGLTLWKNFNHLMNGQPFEHYYPQEEFLGLILSGDGRCLASRGALVVPAEKWLKDLKKWIDKKWMYNYRLEGLPQMSIEAQIPGLVRGDKKSENLLYGALMRCGGCGSKVGSTLLSRALGRLPHMGEQHESLKYSIGEDCAVVELKPGGPVTVSSVDFFKAGYLKRDLYLLGKIAAVHAMSDVWAMGAKPLHALALCTVPLAAENLMEDDIADLLLGATEALKENGCQLSGGHTTEGELSVGFCVEGTADNVQSLWTKNAMRPGDVLVLTKPLGTGMILAGAMRNQARGVWIEAAMEWMQKSNKYAAEALHETIKKGVSVGVTDVTGFGLVGHLVEMCKDSDVQAKLKLSDIEVMDGVEELARRQVFSSLQPENLRSRRGISEERSSQEALASFKYAAIFDPQTSGGLLISLPQNEAKNFIKKIPEARIIGSVEKGPWTQNGGIVVDN